MILGIAKVALCQGYRGIIPLHSTCEDVKRVLGVSTCEASNPYELGNERIKIIFSKAPCEKAWQKSWNVLPGTVMSVERFFINPIPLSSLNIALSKYEKTYLPSGETTYISDEDGVSFTESGGTVSSIAYTPTSKDDYLICSEKFTSQQHEGHIKLPTRWLDRYGDLLFSKEKKRLDLIAEELQAHPPTTEVYFVLYYTRRDCKNAALARAERAKNYLVQTYGINPNRIKTIAGGLKKEFEVVVYLKPVS